MSSAAATLRAMARLGARERVLIAARRGTEPDMEQADQVSALLDAVRVLDGAGLAYALIGGLAVGVHSQVPRATLDVDFAVPSTARREDLIAALAAAGFTLSGEFPHSLNFHASGEPVQLAQDQAFDPMIAGAESTGVVATDVRIVCKDDLIDMKCRAAADPTRPRSKALRDEADVALLRGDTPDPDEGW